MTTKKPSKFGGANYQPKHLGPEPAAEAVTMPQTVVNLVPKKARIKAYSSRITLEAEAQLKALAVGGVSQTELLAEALNLLFKARGLPESA